MKTIKKYVKEEIDVFGDGQQIEDIYSVEIYILKQVKQISKEEYEEKNNKE